MVAGKFVAWWLELAQAVLLCEIRVASGKIIIVMRARVKLAMAVMLMGELLMVS